jgi:hypothetical protein
VSIRGKAPKARLLKEYLDRTRPAHIGADEWREIAAFLAPVSDRTIRKMLRESDWPLDPLVEGVRQDSLGELERTLLALHREYETGDAVRRQACRRAVIVAKDHARFRRNEKQEMILWMLTWLENPSLFPLWLRLRKDKLQTELE